MQTRATGDVICIVGTECATVASRIRHGVCIAPRVRKEDVVSYLFSAALSYRLRRRRGSVHSYSYRSNKSRAVAASLFHFTRRMAPSASRPAGAAGEAQAKVVLEEHQRLFNEAVTKRVNKQASNGTMMKQDRYDYILSTRREFPNLAHEDKKNKYSIAQHYRIQTVGESEWIVPGKAGTRSLEELQRYVHTGELFELIRAEHLVSGHGKHTTLHKALSARYTNITRKIVGRGLHTRSHFRSP